MQARRAIVASPSKKFDRTLHFAIAALLPQVDARGFVLPASTNLNSELELAHSSDRRGESAFAPSRGEPLRSWSQLDIPLEYRNKLTPAWCSAGDHWLPVGRA